MVSKKQPQGFGKKKTASLQESVEIVKDTADNDVLPYVEHFMMQMSEIKPLEEISLLTQEDAQQALGMIDDTLRQLNQRLGVARSLKQVLEAKRRSGAD